jgi:hypothetical protein
MAVRGAGNTPNLSAQLQGNAREDAKADSNREEKAHAKHGPGHKKPVRFDNALERRLANARKHEAELDDEAIRHLHVDDESMQVQREADLEEDRKIKGINLDDERKKKGWTRDGGEDGKDEDDEQLEAAKKSLGTKDGAGKYFEDLPEDRLGDPSLTDPNEMKRQLGPSVRFAQHAMMLAHERMKEGMPRGDALQFLASVYLGVADRAYARKALREFGPATGILDLYPVELMKHLLEHVPSFLPKIHAGHFFAAVPTTGYDVEAGETITLSYDPELKIRGFALKGGETPGYLFEPGESPGEYHLSFAHAGEFHVLISALAKGGVLTIEEFPVRVRAGASDDVENSESMRRARQKANVEDADGEKTAAAKPKKKQDPADLKFVIPRRI